MILLDLTKPTPARPHYGRRLSDPVVLIYGECYGIVYPGVRAGKTRTARGSAVRCAVRLTTAGIIVVVRYPRQDQPRLN